MMSKSRIAIGIPVALLILTGCGDLNDQKSDLIKQGCEAAVIGEEPSTWKNFQDLVAIDPGYINAANGAISWAKYKVHPSQFYSMDPEAMQLALVEYSAFRAVCATQFM